VGLCFEIHARLTPYLPHFVWGRGLKNEPSSFLMDVFMKALRLVNPRTFEHVTLQEPSAPGPGEVLVAVRKIGICGTDISGYLGKMPFIEYPRILGHELGVEVLAVGEGVDHIKVGDGCSVEPYLHCGDCFSCKRGCTNCCQHLQVLGVHVDGGMREQMILPAFKLHPAKDLSFEQFALVETLAIGCHAVARAKLTPGEDALVIGAGPIGLTVVIFAQLAGATVTVLELNEQRREFVTRHFPNVRVLGEITDGIAAAHAVFDATGHPVSMARALGLARFTGRIVFVGITREPVLLDDPLFHQRELTLMASRNALPGDFRRIIDLMTAGSLDVRPWITHRCVLEDLPAQMPDWACANGGVVKAIVSL
jgi:alcohol dehydrogenase